MLIFTQKLRILSLNLHNILELGVRTQTPLFVVICAAATFIILFGVFFFGLKTTRTKRKQIKILCCAAVGGLIGCLRIIAKCLAERNTMQYTMYMYNAILHRRGNFMFSLYISVWNNIDCSSIQKFAFSFICKTHRNTNRYLK